MERLEKIAGLENEVQAQLLGVVLTERGIPHVIRSYHDSAYDGIYQAQYWGHVEAAGSAREEILAVLAEIKREATGEAALDAGGDASE